MIEVDVTLRFGDFTLAAAFTNDAGITALFGRSGSGKTTIINLIAGLARPDRGRITLDDRPLVDTAAGISVPRHRRRIGLVFQDGQLFPHLTVKQNLLFGRWFAPRAADVVRFEPVVSALGIGHLLDRRPTRLSGGEKQRVALGRALLANPRLLLMDEPLASLDLIRKQEILALIEQLRDEFAIPIVYVSHAVEEVARLASKVIVLDRGRVRAAGAPIDVLGTVGDVEHSGRFALASVLEMTAAAHDPDYGITPLRGEAGTVYLIGTVRPPGRRVRVVIRATDVALATERPQSLSIRNTLKGTIAAIDDDGPALVAVTLALPGGGRLTASLTRMALAELALAPGTDVFALIKTVALDEGALAAGGAGPARA